VFVERIGIHDAAERFDAIPVPQSTLDRAIASHMMKVEGVG
jgi:hypothetical protein